MKYRVFGPSGLRASELVLGAMTFGEEWGWGAPVEECRRIVEAYAEAGGNVVDTANAYTDGASERIVGEILEPDRDRWVVSTKYTVTVDGADPNASGNHRKSLTRSLERSLRQLRTDRVDLFWVHIWDEHTPIEETMRALDDAVRAGKVLYVGISDTPAWVVSRAQMLAELRGWTPFVGVQVPYSLTQRDVERELLPMADGLGLSVTAWSPLASGVLSGKFTRGAHDGPTRIPADQVSARDLTVAREVDAVADELGATSSQVALAWTMARRTTIHPIIGARRLDQLADNLRVVDLALPSDQLERLDRASAIAPSFPSDFIDNTRGFVYGSAGVDLAGRP